jgi:hypothetical protein
VVAETVSWPLTCNVPSLRWHRVRREAFWRLITERLSARQPISQRQAGTTATLTWSRHCRSEHIVLAPHRVLLKIVYLDVVVTGIVQQSQQGPRRVH